jgi:curved DNA binding protein
MSEKDFETQSESGSEKEEEITIASDAVVNKYKIAADIANKALQAVLDAVEADKSTLDLCKIGDKIVQDETNKLFKKVKQMKKGIAWPTSVSVNNIICHYSPLESYPTIMVLKNGDMVKVEIGAHIDGFPAFGAHTKVVGASADNPVKGRQADVVWAAYNAAEVSLRMLKPGTINREITKIIQETTGSYDCNPIQNMASYNIEKDVVEGEKTILQNPVDQLSKMKAENKDENPSGEKKFEQNNAVLGEKQEIEVNDVWCIDVLASTGEGRVCGTEVKTSLFRRNADSQYQLKMKTSREMLSKATDSHGFMTFSLRDFDNETRTRLGLKECINHEVVTPHAVMQERPGEMVAQFKYTVLVLPHGILKVTGLNFEKDIYLTEKEIKSDEINKLLATSISKKANKKKKKKAKAAAAASIAEATK